MDQDEDKRDFDLLNRAIEYGSLTRTSSSSTATTTTTPSGSTLSSGFSNDHHIWPLHLAPNFVGHYICGDLIGSGSYAEVRECIDTKSLERCAMKIVNKNYLKRQAPRALSNQLQEIRLLRHLRHPNIILMRECLFEGPKIYLILEYCSFSLSELLEDQPNTRLAVPIARDVFNQLCCGLNHLHSIGIVHRDVKPQNMLITNCGCLKLIDFGVSQLLSMFDRNDNCYNYEGSPFFQAPEVVCGQREYSGTKVDVWSAGVCLYLMLYGQYPFHDEALLGLYDRILAQEVEFPDGPPTQNILVDLLSSLLDKDSSRRASIDQILEHPWLKLSNNHNNEDTEHMELVDLLIGKYCSRERQLEALHRQQQPLTRSDRRDIYRSTSVLPYLYKHHYPQLSITRANTGKPHEWPRVDLLESLGLKSSTQGSGSSNSSVAGGLSSRSPSPKKSPIYGTEESANTRPSSHNSSGSEQEVEWGTREQYQLMKVPPVRANRIKSLSNVRRRKHR